MPPDDQFIDSFDFHAFSIHLNIVFVFDTFLFESNVERTFALGHFIPCIDYVLTCQNYLIRVSQKLDLSVIESLLIEAYLLLEATQLLCVPCILRSSHVAESVQADQSMVSIFYTDFFTLSIFAV